MEGSALPGPFSFPRLRRRHQRDEILEPVVVEKGPWRLSSSLAILRESFKQAFAAEAVCFQHLLGCAHSLGVYRGAS
jgi:hypothetical protein